jgi:hypothetical protein
MKHTTDYITVVDDVISPEMCKDLIEAFEKKPHLARSEDYYQFAELNLHQDPDFKEACKAIQGAATLMIKEYKRKHNATFIPDQFTLEQFRMKRYSPNGVDQFDWHTDVGDYKSARRFLVCLMYINDVEEGGQTAFDSECDDEKAIKVDAKAGRLVMFPPTWQYPHKGMKPVSGNKYIISTYGHYV